MEGNPALRTLLVAHAPGSGHATAVGGAPGRDITSDTAAAAADADGWQLPAPWAATTSGDILHPERKARH
jgi:hypothetical protein